MNAMPKKQKEKTNEKESLGAALIKLGLPLLVEIVSPEGAKLTVGAKAFELIYKAEGFKLAK